MQFWSQAWPNEATLADAPTEVEADDDELAARARTERQSFALLYQRYVAPIYRYCYLRLGQREAAEDATANVFLKALTNISSYHGGQFSAWLFRIAHNTVVDAQRRRHPQQPLDEVSAIADRAPGPEDIALDRDFSILAELNDERRAVLELHLAGCTDLQAAAILGKTASAVKMLRRRALSQLRQTILDRRDQP